MNVSSDVGVVPHHAPLVVVRRDGHVESVHYGSVAVVDRTGRLIYRAGDPEATMYTRSTLKPLQAMALIRAGGLERLGLDLRALALMCASHNAEPEHVAVVHQILKAAGRSPDDLRCGVHVPMLYSANGTTPPPDLLPSPVHHNCSGKHAGMLALCTLMGADHAGYTELDHPVQRAIRTAVAEFMGVEPGAMWSGTDNCSAPNYGVPLMLLARSYARLTSTDEGPHVTRIFSAMNEHAHLISGIGRQDAAITESGRGDWISKIGGEAVQAIGIRSRGLGIAIKISDGDKGDAPRAILPVVIATLRELGMLGAGVPEPLQRQLAAERDIHESRFRFEIEPGFRLEAA